MSAYQRFSDDADDADVVSSSTAATSSPSSTEAASAKNSTTNSAERSAVKIFMSYEDGDEVLEANIDMTEIPLESLTDDASASQRICYRFATNLYLRLLSLVLIFLDVSFVIAEWAVDEANKIIPTLTALSMTIVSYFVVEVCVRIYGYGIRIFFSRRHFLDVIDFVIIVLSFVANLVDYLIVEKNEASALRFLVAFRIIRVFMLVRFINEKKNMEKAARKKISQNKMRYVDKRNGFDLDLTYITSRVIAMSFPSVGLMAVYRNPIKEVVRFFNSKHPNAFKIYNLCSEREYNPVEFDGRVERYFIDDHNVPPLEDMIRFAKDVEQFLGENENNVVAAHCKGGKGRTGTMICTWMLHSKAKSTAKEALAFFGEQRTDFTKSSKFQGVETPSQSRYVGYYEKLLRDFCGAIPSPPELIIKSLEIRKIGGVGAGNGSDFQMLLSRNRTQVFDCDFGTGKNCLASCDATQDTLTVTIRNCPPLLGDSKVKFVCSHKKVPVAYDACAFFFWFHTSFIDPETLSLTIPREELDNPHKSKTWNCYRDGFAVTLKFDHYVVLDTNAQ